MNSKLTTDNKAVSYCQFTPNSKYIVSATLDSSVRLWQYSQSGGKCVREYHGHHVNTQFCCAVQLVNDGKTVAVGSEDGHVVMYDLHTQAFVDKLQVGDTSDIVMALRAHKSTMATAAMARPSMD